MPPGSKSLGSGGKEGTSVSYVPSVRAGSHSAPHRVLLACAVVIWVSIYVGEHLPSLASFRWLTVVCAGCLAVLFTRGLTHAGTVMCVVVLCGLCAGASAWHGTRDVIPGPCSGVATLRSDPELFAAGTAVVLELNGLRYRTSAYNMAGRRLAQRVSGQSVLVSGQCEKLSGDFARRDRVKHIVGRMSVDEVSENFSEGSAFIRTANRIRTVIADGVSSMSPERRSLFLGLVIGDDRAQPQEMVQRFRESGLSHLCAVSGQNVAFLLLLIRPLTSRRHRVVAWGITIMMIAWFVVVTRAEPSIVRASVMAAVVATSSLVGKNITTRTVLACTVCALLMVDPMLAWSVGFALSVAATAGLAWLSAPCAQLFRSGQMIASTFAAQVGTTPISLLVFGTAPVISLVANPFAIPVAGLVMTIGLPMALMAAIFPMLADSVGSVLSVPVGWVDGVAKISAAVAPSGLFNLVIWGCVVIAVLWRRQRYVNSLETS